MRCIRAAAESAKDCKVHEYLTSAIPVASIGPTVRSPVSALNVLLTAQPRPCLPGARQSLLDVHQRLRRVGSREQLGLRFALAPGR